MRCHNSSHNLCTALQYLPRAWIPVLVSAWSRSCSWFECRRNRRWSALPKHQTAQAGQRNHCCGRYFGWSSTGRGNPTPYSSTYWMNHGHHPEWGHIRQWRLRTCPGNLCVRRNRRGENPPDSGWLLCIGLLAGQWYKIRPSLEWETSACSGFEHSRWCRLFSGGIHVANAYC